MAQKLSEPLSIPPNAGGNLGFGHSSPGSFLHRTGQIPQSDDRLLPGGWLVS